MTTPAPAAPAEPEDDPRYRAGWQNQPEAERIWRPRLTPGHPFNEPRPWRNGPDDDQILAWSGLTPDELAAIFDLAPWIRGEHYNQRPRHDWFLDLADAFPDLTFHGFVHTRYAAAFNVEGGDLIGSAERVLELQVWVRDARAASWKRVRRAPTPEARRAAEVAAWAGPDDVHLHRIGEGRVRDHEAGPNAHRPEDAGRWHYWFWWD